ncbi:MAG TPA: M28 family peptidase [Roseiflexaceae bacterium]|nr:M28 family peptidase [Roseiflexaceae bacterium]
MTDPLDAARLLEHVRALADGIGPRPTGHPAEAQARDYIRRTLAEAGIATPEELPFDTWDTWGYPMAAPTLLSLAACLLGGQRRSAALGTAVALGDLYHLWRTFQTQKQPLAPLFPKRPSGTLLARLPPIGVPKRRVVLAGHTDSNKERPTFGPTLKHGLRTAGTATVVAHMLAALALAWETARPSPGSRRARRASALALAAQAGTLLYDERGPYNPGANDNASAVACLLGLGAQLRRRPMRHTEVWLAFTGSEESNCLGLHTLLDRRGEELREAWFIDFELVGAPEVAFVTEHSSMTYLHTYTPDAQSVDLARQTQQRHPELKVQGRAVVINDEVAALRRRGFRGICLVGLGPDGWLPNWHQPSDTTTHLDPSGLERAARFALGMIETLDSR